MLGDFGRDARRFRRRYGEFRRMCKMLGNLGGGARRFGRRY